ncbi:MAG: hypothetical protein JJE52_17675 [Acidimicrobiia bacterium]|nr:hypothetical protein [Acidimicrobiia bacterium]
MTAGLQRQLDALDDREVTEAEYRQESVDARECMLREGLEVSEIHQMIDPAGWQFMFMFEPGSAPPDQTYEIADRCETEHRGFVAGGWAHRKADSVRPEYMPRLQEGFPAPFSTCSGRA